MRRPFRTLVLAAACATVAGGAARAQCTSQPVLFTIPDGLLNDARSRAIDADGDRVLVGLPNTTGPTAELEGAFLFREGVDGWEEEAVFTPSVASDFGAALALSGDLAAVGAQWDETVSVPDKLAAGAVHPFSFDGSEWVAEPVLYAPDPSDHTRFGTSVALSGDRLFVGAPQDSRGTVYCYRRVAGAWVLEDQLFPTAPPGPNEEDFGWSLSWEGGILAVGAPWYTNTHFSMGMVYAFRDTPGGLVEEARIVADNPSSTLSLGESVSVSGERIAAGSDEPVFVFEHAGGGVWEEAAELPIEEGGASSSWVGLEGDFLVAGFTTGTQAPEAVFVYERAGGQWLLQHRLDAGSAELSDDFGYGVDLDGGRVFAGGNSQAFLPAGEIAVGHLFDLADLPPEPGAEVEAFGFSPADDGIDLQFGWSLDQDGEWLAVGTPRAPSPTFVRGLVNVYRRVGGTWVDDTLLWSDGGELGGGDFGFDLSLSGDRLIVGSVRHPDGSSALNEGVAYLYEHDGAAWVQLERIEPPAPVTGHWSFGKAVVVEGDRAFVSAPSYDVGPGQNGAVFVYEIGAAGDVTLVQTLTDPDAGFGGFGDQLAAAGDFLYVTDLGLPTRVIPYRFVGGDYTPGTPIVSPTGDTDDDFGLVLAADGSLLAIGAPDDDVAAFRSGAVFLYHHGPSGWVLAEEVRHPNAVNHQYFGSALDLLGERLVVGVPGVDSQLGEVDVFRFNGVSVIFEAGFAPFQPFEVTRYGDAVALGDESFAVGHPESYWQGGGVASYDLPLELPLRSETTLFSLAAGGTQDFTLHAGACYAGRTYWLLGSLSGTAPGIDVGLVHLPLNPDAYTTLTLTFPNVAPWIDTLGVLDGNGEATAAFFLPPGTTPALVGLALDHAYVVLDPETSIVFLASNAMHLDFVP